MNNNDRCLFHNYITYTIKIIISDVTSSNNWFLKAIIQIPSPKHSQNPFHQPHLTQSKNEITKNTLSNFLIQGSDTGD